MSPERHRRAKEVFLAARGLPRPARGAFVEEACGEDHELLQDVESLLDVLDKAGPAVLEESFPRIDNYRILRKLGEGGMGEVYEAEQTKPIRRRVALKVIRWGLESSQVTARFESERQALAIMDHPAIARVFEAGATAVGRPYFAMEYVAGLPITDYCDLHRLDPRERLELFLALCAGVDHAHSQGVIHRDIKPANVLVKHQDGQHVPKLIDFGVAKATAQRLTERTLYTELGQWIGTPEYMSPEQAELGNRDVDARTDVYSLGVLLYELLVGAQPFDAKALREADFDEMRRKIREDEMPPPSGRLAGLGRASQDVAENRRTDVPTLQRQLHGDLDRIVMKALEKEPERRYSSPGPFAADVRRYLSGEPVRARAPSTVYRLGKLARRHRRRLGAGALALSMLFLGAATANLWLRREGLPAVEAGGRTAEPNHEISVAVLPFVNLSTEPENEYFSDGLSEELLNALAQVRGLRVAARTSSFAYKGRVEDVRTIGKSLGVGNILEGSVRRSGDALRVTAQLVGVEDGFHLWSGTFERQLGDVFAIQDEISRAVADALKVELLERASLPHGTARTIDVYDLYLKGRHRLRDRSPEALSAAIELFREAIALDPTYAPAHTGSAEAYLLLARRGDLPMEEADRQAGAALKRALELDSRLPEAHAALGLVRSAIGDPEGAESALRRAIELNASLASAHLRLGGVLAARNRPDEADAAYRRALTLDPLNLSAHHAVAGSLMNSGRYEDAMLHYERWLRIEPDSAETYRVMSLFARTYGRLDDAAAWAHRAVELDPKSPLNLHELVMTYAGLGELDKAAEWMERAYDLAPNNHWTFTLKAFLYVDRGDFDALESFTQQLLDAELLHGAGPLPQVMRLRLALAGLSKVYQGDYPNAVELYERALGKPFTGILEPGIDADTFAFLAYAYRRLDRQEEADAAMDRCLELVRSRQDWIWAHLIVPENVAGIYALQGREEEAVKTLEQAFADGWLSYSQLVRTPHFESLRQREDFQQLMGRVKMRVDELRDKLKARTGASDRRPEERATPRELAPTPSVGASFIPGLSALVAPDEAADLETGLGVHAVTSFLEETGSSDISELTAVIPVSVSGGENHMNRAQNVPSGARRAA